MSDAATTAFRLAPIQPATGPTAALARERARAEGYAAGFSAGSRVAAREAQALQGELTAAAKQAEQRRTDEHVALVAALTAAVEAAGARTAPVLADAQATLFAAAVELASVIVGHELSSQASAAVAALERVSVADPGVQVVRMHPLDVAAVQTIVPMQVQFVPDESIERGSAISEHENGYLDATIGAALQRARVALEQVAA